MTENRLPELIHPAPGERNCWIYDTEEEHRLLLTPYLRAGLERGEKVMYIVDNHTEKQILDYLEDDGVNVKPYIKSGQLTIMKGEDAFPPDGVFEPEKMITLLERETQKALDEGYAALRTSTEMSWASRALPGSERLIEYEAKLNQFFRLGKCYGLCQYERRLFGPDVLLDVLRTHPGVVLGTRHFDNPYYIPPDAFLADGSEAAMLDHWIQNLLDRHDSEEVLRESEAKYRRIVDNAQEGIWGVDENGVNVFVNQQMADMLGYSVEEMLGRPMYDFIGVDGSRVAQNNMELRQAGVRGGQYDFEFMRKDGSKILTHVSASGIYDEDGQYKGSIDFITDITGQGQAEEALRDVLKRERLLADMVRFASIAVDQGTLDGRIISVNQAFCELTGYSEDELKTLDWSTELTPPEWRYMESIKLRELVETRQPVTYEKEYIKKDGYRVPVELVVHPVFDESGELERYFSFITDITDRKRAESALLQSEEKYRRIVDRAQEGIYVNNADRIMTFANRRMAEMLGYEVEELIGHGMYEFVAAEDMEVLDESWQLRQQGIDGQFEIRITKKDGGIIYTNVSTAGVFDQHGNFDGSVSLINDISKRKKAEQELRETRDYLDSLIRYANAPIIVWDPDRKIIRFNDAFEFLTGYRKEKIIGQPLDILFPADGKEEALERIGLALAGDYLESVEIPILCKNGEIRIALWNSANIYGEDGGLIATIAQGQDITDRKKHEKELLESRERWQRSFDVISDAMFLIDGDFVIRQHNKAFCELLGETGDYTGRKCYELMHDSKDPPGFCICNKAIRNKLAVEGEIYEPELDKHLAVSLAPIFDDKGDLELGIHVIRDITEHALAQKALQESEEKYRLIVDNAQEGIWTVDQQANVIFCNERMAEMLGYEVEEIVKHPVFKFMDKKASEAAEYRMERRMQGIGDSYEFEFVCKDGSRLHTSVNASPLFGENGAYLGSLGFFTDVTSRKAAEDALARELEMNKAIADLSASLLSKASIKTISQMVLEIASRLTESRLGYVGYIDSDTGNLSYTSLDMSRSGSGRFTFRELEGARVVAVEKRRGFFSNSPSDERRALSGPLRGTTVKRFIWMPSLMGEARVGQILLANSARDYDEKDLELLQRLADIYAVALLGMWSEEELDQYRQHLEDLVRERTLDLDRINQQLEGEILER